MSKEITFDEIKYFLENVDKFRLELIKVFTENKKLTNSLIGHKDKYICLGKDISLYFGQNDLQIIRNCYYITIIDSYDSSDGLVNMFKSKYFTDTNFGLKNFVLLITPTIRIIGKIAEKIINSRLKNNDKVTHLYYGKWSENSEGIFLDVYFECQYSKQNHCHVSKIITLDDIYNAMYVPIRVVSETINNIETD